MTVRTTRERTGKKAATRIACRSRVRLLTTTSALALGMIAATGPAMAKDTSGRARTAAVSAIVELAQASVEHDFNIPSQPLAEALIAFGEQAELQVSFNPATSNGLISNAVSGRLTARAALDRLLAGLPVQQEFSGESNVTISTLDQSGQGPVSLRKLRVEAEGQTATGPVEGYFATNSASGTKTDTPVIETPRAVSVVTADQISDRKVQNVEDALRYTPGVHVNGYGNDPRFDQIQVRGFALTTNTDFRDGLRQSNTGWLSYFKTEPYGLERIDVVKGPGSVLYGQASPGGFVNRVSKRPSLAAENEVELQLGTDEHRQGQFDIGGSVLEDDTLLYRAVGLIRESESNLVGVNDDNRYFAPSVTWTPTEKLSVTVLTQYQDFETAASPRPYQYASGELSHIWAGDEDFDRMRQKQAAAGYEASYEFNDIFSVHQNLRFGSVSTENQYTSAGTLAADGRTLSRSAIGLYEDQDSIVVDTRGQARFRTGPVSHLAIAGIDYFRVDGHIKYLSGTAPSLDLLNPDYSQSIARPSSFITNQNREGTQIGIYAQDQVSWENWRLNFGLRHDKADLDTTNNLTSTTTSADNSATSGNAGVLYLFDSGFAPYASYATSFLPQFSSNASGETYEPTEGEQFEIGLKYQPPGRNSIYTATVYHLTEKNKLTSDPGNPGNQIQTGEQRHIGLELEANMTLLEGLQMTAGYSYIDAEITKNNDGNEGKTPTAVPEHSGSVWTNYAFADNQLEGLQIGAGARFIGETFDDSANTNKNDSQLLFDARISYALDAFLPGATLAVNATNLTDEDQETCEFGYCYRGRGRVVIGSINYRW
ncbi:TonB-dependent siderophore receptor [Nisaea acidiphila]|uniref:TonB-dependent siderophore receptor n=1 Tax=Nisaea acidiphila TaxID=1862145 RepID=A0A9J7APY6_9PROT|nr:TonB-dependent siderophore receptor [Nisaea acidiphila]UUX49287.1 TonB-dependent siderophore receptor [Nisaea acidiphila]